ncbi:MAG TPA: LysM peptidoglycan-binding domain-containing protein [Verrucomicrobiae bacterium]|nr:LysM peptidoglycan-binding domain-containing protein [Verrucomicrobiae bacterium]
MKRFVCLSALGLLCFAPLLRAQDATTAAAAATRQEAEENYNNLKGHVDDLIAAQESLEKRIQMLEKDIADLRLEMSKPSANYASQDELKELAKAVQEIDKKREADKELILKEIEKLAKVVSAPPPTHIREKPPKAHHSESGTEGNSAPPITSDGGDQTGFYYEIKSGDTFSLIAQAYREQGIKVYAHQIAEANPNVNPAKLLVGTKIFIPAPKGSSPKNPK